MTTTGPAPETRDSGAGSVFVEFTIPDGQDNARMSTRAVPEAPADLDLFLQRQEADGSWSEDVASGTNFGGAAESLSTDRLGPGTYRLEVYNYAGPPGNAVDVAMEFFNSAGVRGT